MSAFFHEENMSTFSLPGQGKDDLNVTRLVDVGISVLVLLLNIPLVLVLACLIKLDSPGPVIFMQKRVGKNGKHFLLYKLRTMVDEAEKDTGPIWALFNDARITKVGKFLRRWRLDEIPQFWNVLKGDMSLIGPRPERPYFVTLLEKEIPSYSLRHRLKPGITGWAQVNLLYHSNIDEAKLKFQYDLWYIQNRSVLVDLRIAIRTVWTILKGKGR